MLGRDTGNPQDVAKPSQNALTALDQEIALHQQHDRDEGVLSSWLAHVWDGGKSKSLSNLEALQTQARTASSKGDQADLQKIEQLAQKSVEADRKALESCDTGLGYASGFLKSAGLFMGNKYGLALTLATYGIDSAHAGDSVKGQLADGLLGAGKGLALRKTFEITGKANWNPVAQGVTVGFLSSFSDLALTRSTYQNGLVDGLETAAIKAADPKALAIDAGTFVVARGLFGGANALSAGKLAQNRLLSTMVTGGSFGITSGAANEIYRQHINEESTDWSKILSRGLIQGGLDAVAAAPSGAMRSAEKLPTVEQNNETSTSNKDGSKLKREFVVTSGHEALGRFVAAGDHIGEGALLKVREIKANRPNLGAEQTMFVQHLDLNSRSTNPPADLLASCVEPGSKPPANHALPGAEGPVRLSVSSDHSRIAVTTSDTTVPGYERSIQLGGVQEGERIQRELLGWVKQPNGPETANMAPALIEARALRNHVQRLLNDGWELFETGKESAADNAKMDYLLRNENSGLWTFFDTTMDLDSKAGVSPLHRSRLVELSKEGGSLSLQSRIDFMYQVIDAAKGSDLFDSREIRPPSWNAADSPSTQVKEIIRFRREIANKIAQLKRKAHEQWDGDEKWYWNESAEELLSYDRELELAQKFVSASSDRAEDARYPARLNAVKAAIVQATRNIVCPMLARNETYPEAINGEPRTRVEFDPQYDRVSVFVNGQRYKLEGVQKMIAETVQEAVLRKDLKDFGYKREMMAGQIADRVRVAVMQRLERMSAAKLLGEPGLIDTGSNGKAKKQR